ncbi:MFS transporter [Arsenicicoccus piscis]|uniref:MFS transporter n=1 Tax=Arsenicicoccus piscis TaxID=673954 RepID=A0ABQ6HHL9_9MICO|nr:MFS transporter [Arsenicicoccus piscis]MCH8627632.1 MFS transporter [Arsenicicoccus piscis]GMA18126.1 MFS transporter [Arsenicicoccus piscis]
MSEAPTIEGPHYLVGGRRAWLIFAVGVLAYALAIFNRTSLGVAGLVAAQRFGISASQLATFTVLQLLVYAAMQVPVGAMLDRYGSRVLLLVGTLLMTVAQLAFALVPGFWGALAARFVLGMGDAMMFVSVLRLVALWFPSRRVPLLSQLTGQIGQLGVVASSVPLSLALRHVGWERAFLGAAAAGIVSAVAIVLVVKNTPVLTPTERAPLDPRVIGRLVREAWREPGTRLGLWTHFTTMFAANVFSLLWGFPFLVRAQGLSEEVAGTMLVVMSATMLVTGPVVGLLTSRWPYRRSDVVLIDIAAIATIWSIVLLWPGRAPLWLLVLLAVVTATGGPTSAVGFDFARTMNPAARFGTSNGIVNVGGFVASLVVMGLVGFTLDLLTPQGGPGFGLTEFRWAFATMYLAWALGAFQILRLRGQVRHLKVDEPAHYAGLIEGELPRYPRRSRDPRTARTPRRRRRS